MNPFLPVVPLIVSFGVIFLCLRLCVPAPAASLRTILRDGQTFSAHLSDHLALPPPVVQSLLSARVTLGPVSTAPSPFPVNLGILAAVIGACVYPAQRVAGAADSS